MAKLIIVESPGKIKTISSYLPKDYIVMASMGHIRLLDKTGKHNLGIDVENTFEPSYSNDPAKKDVIKKLKAAAKTADAVYLASDADLEGESISWHLKEILGVPAKKLFRITFNEITKKAIEEALKNPRQIDTHKVDAQETRRLLDRIVGFRLSGLAISKLGAKSAGRVQSSALKILVDRELEIKAFVPKEYYEIHLPFTKNGTDYVAKYKGTDKKKIVSIPSKADVDKIISELTDKNYKVGEIKAKDRKMQAKAPYTTSSFQQEVSARLGYAPKRAMQIAQSLYEGMSIEGKDYGLITYMRTDSARLSDDFIKEAKELIEKDYGKKYYSGVVHTPKKSGQENVQDAHEGIRPTHLELTPEKVKPFLSSEEWRVYTLIYNRSLAALMTDAQIKDTEVMIHNNQHRFGITGHEIIFDGFLKVYKEFKEDEEDDAILPSFSIGEVINNKPLKIERKETTPPGRYTEASLVKKMEELGIGRPSTYASIVETLKGRDYTEAEKKTLKPTDKGIEVVQMLDAYFDTVINTTYTAQMEDKLDQIADGKLEKLTQLKEFYDSFEPLVLKAHREVNKNKEKPQMTDKVCAKCAAPMVIRSSKFGQFYACSKFPKCKHTEKMEGAVQANATPTVAPVSTGKTCPVCNEGQLVKRIAKTGKNAGSSFYACNKFPKCKTTYNEEQYVAQFGAAPDFSNISTDTE